MVDGDKDAEAPGRCLALVSLFGLITRAIRPALSDKPICYPINNVVYKHA